MNKKLLELFVILTLLAVPGPLWAAIDLTAQVVELRTDCGTKDNCFSNLGGRNGLNNAYINNRTIDESSPLTVLVGPGTFPSGSGIVCVDSSHLTIRGTSRKVSIIEGTVSIFGCSNFTMESLTIKPPGSNNAIVVSSGSGAPSGLIFRDLDITGQIKWTGAGDSKWYNVDATTTGGIVYTWQDLCDSSGIQSTHFWYDSVLTTNLGQGAINYGAPYWARCSRTYMFGGEVAVLGVPGSSNFSDMAAVDVAGGASVRMFGVAIKALNNGLPFNPTGGGGKGQFGLRTQFGGSEIHIHGSVITVDGGTSILARDGSFIHTPGTAFTGNPSTRIVEANGGVVDSPFQWPKGSNPPNVNSVTGADTFVETDCSAGGSCSGGTDPHLMIYSSNCTANGPWFDVVTGACRQ